MFNDIFNDKLNTTLILGSSIAAILVTYWIKSFLKLRNFFKDRNFPGPSPLPILGNFYGIIKQGLVYHDLSLMQKYGKICGYFEGSTPVIMTTDVKFMKNFMIKDFSSFVNRRIIDSMVIEPSDKFLTVLKDEEWKNVRSILTTTFTSGKLKQMSKCMHNCIINYENYLQDLTENKDGIIATKQFFGSYTLDVISSCCFGMDTNAINDPDNVFLKNLQVIFSADISRNPKMILIFLSPSLSGYLAQKNLVEFFPQAPIRFLQTIIDNIIHRRKDKLDRRDDFIQNMIDLEENPDEQMTKEKDLQNGEQWKEEDGKVYKWNSSLKKKLTNKEIMASAVLFLAAGYETTATTLEYIAYNLAMNQDVQDRLLAEIDEVLEKHNGEVNYDSVADMKYMDMVIDETLRIFPPATRLDRVASNDYEYNGLKIDKGQVINVPIYALHHDPDYYPNPEVFDPERFNEENKKARENVAFLPFGAGPRNCIGMRFSLLEIKLLLSSILSKYRFVKCDKTLEKITIDNSGFGKSTKPIFVKVQKRN